MKLPRTLRELFSMPGYAAQITLKPVDGDDRARIVTLRRRKKQPYAPGVAVAAVAVTTREFNEFATCRRRPVESILSLNAGA
jgi:hypothetical protein